MIVSEHHEMITLSYNLPEPYQLSSITNAREAGWIVWVCQLATTFKDGEKLYKHYGRGEAKDLNEAAVRAMKASAEHKLIHENAKKAEVPPSHSFHSISPVTPVTPVTMDELKDLF
jgi:hypothetical protein